MAFCYLLGNFGVEDDEGMAFKLAKESAKLKSPAEISSFDPVINSV